jgi:DNA (cytosine-5)-methyltransferase 1
MTMPMRVLDLFCGAGGASMGLHLAWPEAQITGVDINPQPRYPFNFIQADAMTFPLEGYDFIWASPPCQSYCALKTMKNKREHPALIEPVRQRLQACGVPWVIENVFGAPLLSPRMLCGSFFDLHSGEYQLRRHRYFEANFTIPNGHDCKHWPHTLGVYGSKVRDIAKEKRHYAKARETRGAPEGVVLPKQRGFEAMGITWMNMDELSESIPPAFAKYIGEQFTIHQDAK